MFKIEIKEVYFHLEETKKSLEALTKSLTALSGKRHYVSYVDGCHVFIFDDNKIDKVEELLLKSNIPHRKKLERG